jgi:hypothetical protein
MICVKWLTRCGAGRIAEQDPWPSRRVVGCLHLLLVLHSGPIRIRSLRTRPRGGVQCEKAMGGAV